SAESIDAFHRYSFATLRQAGACFELAATYLSWLQSQNVPGLAESIAGFSELSTGSKTLQFQLARAMSRKKPLDLAPIDRMGQSWASLHRNLRAVSQSSACLAT